MAGWVRALPGGRLGNLRTCTTLGLRSLQIGRAGSDVPAGFPHGRSFCPGRIGVLIDRQSRAPVLQSCRHRNPHHGLSLQGRAWAYTITNKVAFRPAPDPQNEFACKIREISRNCRRMSREERRRRRRQTSAVSGFVTSSASAAACRGRSNRNPCRCRSPGLP